MNFSKGASSKFQQNIIPFLSTCILVVGVAAIYLSNEHFFYWSDFNYYQSCVNTTTSVLETSLINLVVWLWLSLKTEYNMLFAVPLAVFELLLGPSRLVYVESILLVYVIPVVLLTALIVRRLVKSQSYWIFVLLAFMLPQTVAPAFRGYPDHAALLSMLLACFFVLVYRKGIDQQPGEAAGDEAEKDRKTSNWNTLVFIGLFLAMGFIIRRHFAYDCLAFVVALTISEFTDSLVFNKDKRSFFDSFKMLATVALSTIIVMVILGLPIIEQILKNPYGDLYKAFYVIPVESIWYFVSSFGIPVACLSIVGWVMAFKEQGISSFGIRFVFLWSALCPLFWIAMPGQLGIHYLLHFLPFVVIGFSLFWHYSIASSSKQKKSVASCLLFFYLVLNLCVGLLPLGMVSRIKPFAPGMLSVHRDNGDILARMFSANYGPLSRHDDEQMKKLVELLRANSNGKEKEERPLIYVASHSDVLASDIIRNAERYFWGKHESILRFSNIPNIDTRDAYPLEHLLHTDLVVVAKPFQYFVPPQYQDVIKLIVDCFDQKWEIASDFEKLPTDFELDNGVVVSVYKRIKMTDLKTAAITLARMKSYLKEIPGGQPGWISSGDLLNHRGPKNREEYNFPANNDQSFLLYARKLPDSFSVKGTIESFGEDSNFDKIESLIISYKLLNQAGELIDEGKPSSISKSGQSFQWSVGKNGASYFVLIINSSIKLTNSNNSETTGISGLKLKVKDLSLR